MSEETQVQEVPIEELSQEEFKQARAKGVSTVEKPVSSKSDDQQEEKPKSKGGGFQKRIDRLIRQNAALEEQLAAERNRRSESTGQRQEHQIEGDPEPKRESFQNDQDYWRALTRWEVRQETRAEREREQREAAAAEKERRDNAYNKRVAEAKANHDDWVEVVSQPIMIPTGVHEAIKEMDNGPEVAYFLGNNPELCEELMEMSASRSTGMIWSISEKLEAESKKDEQEEEAEEEEKPKAEEKPERKKYEPIRPVGGSNKSSVPLDKMSMADYKKARAAGRTH